MTSLLIFLYLLEGEVRFGCGEPLAWSLARVLFCDLPLRPPLSFGGRSEVLPHPILRIKLNALNSCVPRDLSHTQVDKSYKVSSWCILHHD